MDNPVLVNRLARKLRRAFPDLPIVARARDTAHAAELYKAGVTDAVPETLGRRCSSPKRHSWTWAWPWAQ